MYKRQVQGGGAEGEGASGGATEGENGADGEDGQAVDKPARPKLPDPVFGEDVSEDNLVNPQQKPDSSFIYDTSISALQEADSYLNNQTVQVTGEVIGDRIRAEFDPGYSWIVLQGSDSCLLYTSSVAKLVATGFERANMYLTFQEYFEKLRQDPERWGKPMAAVLGALMAQIYFGVGAIGGKDSMSGSFEDLDVPPTCLLYTSRCV